MHSHSASYRFVSRLVDQAIWRLFINSQRWDNDDDDDDGGDDDCDIPEHHHLHYPLTHPLTHSLRVPQRHAKEQIILIGNIVLTAQIRVII